MNWEGLEQELSPVCAFDLHCTFHCTFLGGEGVDEDDAIVEFVQGDQWAN